jgi:hypothetical protein
VAYFQTENPDLGKFWRVLQWRMLVYYMYCNYNYFTAIWYCLWPSGIFVVIWYIISHFGVLYQEKSCNPAFDRMVGGWGEDYMCEDSAPLDSIESAIEIGACKKLRGSRRRKESPAWERGWGGRPRQPG